MKFNVNAVLRMEEVGGITKVVTLKRDASVMIFKFNDKKEIENYNELKEKLVQLDEVLWINPSKILEIEYKGKMFIKTNSEIVVNGSKRKYNLVMNISEDAYNLIKGKIEEKTGKKF